MKLYNLMDINVEIDYSERYRAFTYDMFALCKEHVGRVDFLDERYDSYCDPMLDYNTPEQLAGYAVDNIDLFLAVVDGGDTLFFPRDRVDWALKRRDDKMKLFVLIYENIKMRSDHISKNSLKNRLYFEEKMYPQSYSNYDELTFWIAVQIMVKTRLTPEVINIYNQMLYFGDVYIGDPENIPAISRSIEYRKAEERGADKERVTVDIIKALVFTCEIQKYRYHLKLRELIDTQMRGDNVGVSLMVNHESLSEEIEEAFEKYKKSRFCDDKEKIEIILTKMQLGLLNSYVINCADESRDDYAEQLKKDINKHRNHLKKFKTQR